jgi:hypothetical protein
MQRIVLKVAPCCSRKILPRRPDWSRHTSSWLNRNVIIKGLMKESSWLRLCLVSRGMQNAKCQLLWNDEMQNVKIFMVCLVPSKMLNFSWGEWRLFDFFFCLLRSKSKMENEYLFVKNFACCLVPFCKIIGQNPKFFRWNREPNTPLLHLGAAAAKLHSRLVP